jgi:hypothetical protein
MNPLIDFYGGTGPDHRGRRLADILKQDDDWLEHTHDFVQWLFPLDESSPVNPHAPTLDTDCLARFAADQRLRMHLRLSFMRMLRFYGLQATPQGIVKGHDWDARKRDWFVRDTHNSLRLTRIIRSLALLGMPREARELQRVLDALCRSEPDCGIGETARRYWRSALDGRAGNGPGR